MSRKRKRARLRNKSRQRTPRTVKPNQNIFETTRENVENFSDNIVETVVDAVEYVKPKLRGWFHLGAIPVVFLGGLFLLIIAPTVEQRTAIAVFVFTSVTLFSVSATYHRTNGWISVKWTKLLQKVDHSSIALNIAGTTTPFAVIMLSGAPQWVLLGVVWFCSLTVVVFKLFTVSSPPLLNVIVFIGVALIPFFFAPVLYNDLVLSVGPRALHLFMLIFAGGLFYSVGGVIFGMRPRWSEFKPGVFGFHELFHLLTILGFLCHYIAIVLLVI